MNRIINFKGFSKLSERTFTNFFYGFSFDGILLACTSGALVSIGMKILKHHHALLTDEDNEDIYQAGKGGGIFAFGLYCWVPPLVRKYYLVLPKGFRDQNDHLGLNAGLMNLAVSGAGTIFAGLTGFILGFGYGHLVCSNDNSNDRDNLRKRIIQCGQGFGILMSGIYLMSPGILKAVWILSYFAVDDDRLA